MTKVRIIILNYNTASLTVNLVNNLLKQTYRNYEIVVVDNKSASNDQNLLASSLPSCVCLIKSNINLGYSGGNNLGMKYNTSFKPDYYFILNSDLELKDDTLIQKLLNGFELNNTKPILAQSPIVNTLHSNNPAGMQIQVRKLLSPLLLYLLSFSLFKRILRGLFNSFIYKSEMPFDNKYLICDSINGAAFIIKAEFMQRNNYFDENIFLYNEEMILAKQIQNDGGACLLNGFTQVYHFQGSATESNLKRFNSKMERLKYQSEAYFFYKYLHTNLVFVSLFKFLKELELQFKIIFLRNETS